MTCVYVRSRNDVCTDAESSFDSSQAPGGASRQLTRRLSKRSGFDSMRIHNPFGDYESDEDEVCAVEGGVSMVAGIK